MSERFGWLWRRITQHLTGSIVWKLWGTTLLLVVLTLVPIAVSINTVLAGFHEKFVKDQLSTWADQYARVLADSGATARTFEALEAMAQISGVDLVLVDAGGLVRLSTSPQLITQGQRLLTPQVRQALAGQTPVEITHSAGADWFQAAAPIVQGNQIAGALLLLEPTTPVKEAVQSIHQVLYWGGAATLLLSAALAYLWSIRLSRPLIDMQRAARRMQAGDFSQRVLVDTSDEVGLLGEAINQLAFNLKRHRDSRNEFLANVSHELRTPLSYMRGYSQALLDGLASTPEESQAYLDIIHDEAERMGRLVEDLFDLARIEEGRLPLEKQPFSIEQTIERLIRRLTPRATEKGVALASAADPDHWVFADEARIEQVLVNLLDNALRHTPSGGQIAVDTKAFKDAIEINVTDTGSGIPEEEITYIWERFHKVDKARVRSGGTGLGLAIVKNLVEAHSGTVSARSELGRGTAITFTLPRAAPDGLPAGQSEGDGIGDGPSPASQR